MPIQPPALDDRSFDDLVNEVVARIPAHTPEYANPRLGDPGRTMIELFAWLTDTLLYRVNLIPERQRLAFLRLLGEQMRPAIAARTLLTVATDDDESSAAMTIKPLATVSGPVNFETRSELTILPITAAAYYKRRPDADEQANLVGLEEDLHKLYKLDAKKAARMYISTPVFPGGAPDKAGFNLKERAIDNCLWLALLAPKAELVEDVRETLGQSESGGQQLLNVGLVPAVEVPDLFQQSAALTESGKSGPDPFQSIGNRARIPHLWELSYRDEEAGKTDYTTLDVVEDTTAGLTQGGTQRLALPASRYIGAPSNDVRQNVLAGVGADEPPRLDDPEEAARVVAWLRLRPMPQVGQLLPAISLTWAGINALEVDQRRTISGRVIGQSDGNADQEFALPAASVERDSFILQVEEPGRGYQPWIRVDDIALAGRDDRAYTLDSEAGIVRFGNGASGRIPNVGSRVRVAMMRAGGGAAGNLPPGTLTGIEAQDLDGNRVTKLKISQPLATSGGADAETLAEAERRIPALFRHRDRAVTGDDFRRLAADTPGVAVGRVEVMPRFKPHQRRSNVPGVVSVMTLPKKDGSMPPNPRPDRPFLESVHGYLEQRRPVGTEMYTIGCEYIPLGISVSVRVSDGFGQEQVLRDIRQALRQYLWPLLPGGPQQEGWPLGRTVRERELEVIVARVTGVNSVNGINLFRKKGSGWQLIPKTEKASAQLTLLAWQLPELLSVVAVADDAASASAPANLDGVPNPFTEEDQIPVPVVPEVCY